MRTLAKSCLIVAAFLITIFATAEDLQVVTLEYPPYASSTLKENGWAWKVVQEASARGKIDAKLTFMPWARALEETKKGNMDALYLANKNPEREKWAVFSDKVGAVISVMWVQKEKGVTFNSMEDLKALNVVALRASTQIKWMEENGINVTAMTDIEQGLLRLKAGRVDVLVADLYTTKHLINTIDGMTLDDFTYSDNEALQYKADFYLAFSRAKGSAEEKAAKFNAGLKQIKTDGTYEAILKDYGL